jgi:pyrophosphatase PpaX
MMGGAQDAITALKDNHLLDIVTGRIRENVFEFPDFERLSPRFSTIVAYEDTELHKPHPEPLLCAATRLGIEPDACVYIGDVENDMKAAHAAGMKGVHFTKSKKHFGDVRLASFRDLPDILADW